MKKTLSSLFALIAWLALAQSAWSQDIKADVAAGEKKAAQCIGCHGIPGYQASFPEVHKVPMISGQDANYITAALNAYAKGERKHPSMRGIATSLKPQDMADLAAFYQQHPKDVAPLPETLAKEPPAEIAGVLKTCAGCHGANFSKPIAGSPKLAGQYADYLYVALKAYQTKGNPRIGRSNPLMTGVAQPLTHAQLKDLAAYLSSLPSELRVVQQSRAR